METELEQCERWKLETPLREDLYAGLETLAIYIDESHESLTLKRCLECGQLYLYEFYEEIDWVDGNDPQYRALTPVQAKDGTKQDGQLQLGDFILLGPVLKSDWPADAAEPTLYWVGRDPSLHHSNNEGRVK